MEFQNGISKNGILNGISNGISKMEFQMGF